MNRNVFRAVLKLFTDGELRTEHGNRFHAAGPATTNARPPNFVFVPLNYNFAASRQPSSTFNAGTCTELRHNWNQMRCNIGNQWAISPVAAGYEYLGKHLIWLWFMTILSDPDVEYMWVSGSVPFHFDRKTGIQSNTAALLYAYIADA